MTRNGKHSKHSMAVRLCIWSIRHQSWLAGQIRIYIYGATALVALLALGDVISIQTAMYSIFCGGVVVMAMIWTLVQRRKTMLNKIKDPEVRDLVHKAMLEYLHQVNHSLPASAGHNGIQKNGINQH